MSPFRRGKYWSLYVPRRSGGCVQRACGTTDSALAKKMGRMIDQLADLKQWDALEAIDRKLITLPEAWDAYCHGSLDSAIADKGTPTLASFIDRWENTLQVAPRTKVQYVQKVRTLIPETMKASAFTAGWCADVIAQLPYTSGTRAFYLNALSVFADYLVAHAVVAMNPMRQPGLVRRPRTNKPRKVWHTEDRDLALVNATTHPLIRVYFALVHSTGAERDAALNMRRRDIDTATWTAHIPGTKNKGRDRRGIPIESWSHTILAAHCKTLLPDALLFDGLTRDIVGKAHVDSRKAINLPDYQLRDSRHSYAIRALLRGEPLWKVSKWLGHSNLNITAKVYADFGIDAALDALGRTASTDLNRSATAGTT